MVQDAINQCVQVLFLVTAAAKPRRWRSAEELALRDATVFSIQRRLQLVFRILLLSARTDYSKDRIGKRGKENRADYVQREVEAYYDRLMVATAKRPPLLLREERAALENRRHAYQVLAWVCRDVMTLVEGKHLGEVRLGEVLATVGKLRALCEDVPMFTRVQLPFVTVALVAVVVHLTIFQLMYCSASYSKCRRRRRRRPSARARSFSRAHPPPPRPPPCSCHGARRKGAGAEGVCGAVFHHHLAAHVPVHPENAGPAEQPLWQAGHARDGLPHEAVQDDAGQDAREHRRHRHVSLPRGAPAQRRQLMSPQTRPYPQPQRRTNP
jgi:hypothetical protein